MEIRNIVILTGAGISAESGIPTFRGPEGFWRVGSRNYHPQEMATARAFSSMPDEVWRWYLHRRDVCRAAAPNAAHQALVQLDERLGERFRLVTQNVDDLHERAGSKRLLHMHGELTRGWCVSCDARFGWSGPMGEGAACPSCSVAGQVRPDIVWFG